jgi:hypothetical protein
MHGERPIYHGDIQQHRAPAVYQQSLVAKSLRKKEEAKFNRMHEDS